MADDSAPVGDEALHDDEGDSPVLLPPFGFEAVPDFCDRLFAHLPSESREEFEFDGVDVQFSHGVWITPLGAYLYDEDQVDGAANAQLVAMWTANARRALRAAWGEPAVRTPRLVGDAQQPEGILDHLMVALGIAEADQWDRGEFFAALLTGWSGEPGASSLQQIMLALPRDYAIGSLSAMAEQYDGITRAEGLMLGENLTELRRRAWLLSALYAEGEARLRDTVLEGSRLALQSNDGTSATWIFTDDGRAVLLVNDPASEFSRRVPERFIREHALVGDDEGEGGECAGEGEVDGSESECGESESEGEREAHEPDEALLAEVRLILASHMLGGVPRDLRELITARAERPDGGVAQQVLEFGVLGDQAVPVLSWVGWFDGEEWHVPAQLNEIGRQHSLGMEDFGFHKAVRDPFQLGGAFTVEYFADPRQAPDPHVEQVFEVCPYPEQPRPANKLRLGRSVPSTAQNPEIIAQIERASAAWWDHTPGEAELEGAVFTIAGHELKGDDRELQAIIAVTPRWVEDAFVEWVNELIDTMKTRWGHPIEVRTHAAETGMLLRSPVTKTMRAFGASRAPMWWVNGHAVLLLAEVPDAGAGFGNNRPATVVIAKPDAVFDLARGTSIAELRLRARLLGELASIAAGPESPRLVSQQISWDGPPLKGSELVPQASRGALRADEHIWVWHFTHDHRCLLMSFPAHAGQETAVGSAFAPSFAEAQEMFRGVPDDLLSLVVDRDADGWYNVVTRTDDAALAARFRRLIDGDGGEAMSERLATARSLPAVQAVFWHENPYWRASDGMLANARAAVQAADGGMGVTTADPLETLYSPLLGVPQLRWTLWAGNERPNRNSLSDPRFTTYVLDRDIKPEGVDHAITRMGNCQDLSLIGTLNDVLDVIVDFHSGGRMLLDAALANPNPVHRREIALSLLAGDLDASSQLSHLTPVNVLLANPTLGAGDAPLLQRLIEHGADTGPGLLGAYGLDPREQLAMRELDAAEAEPLLTLLWG